MQSVDILFQKHEYTIVMDETSYEGNVDFDGENPMISIKKGTVDEIQFNLKQILDNERIALSLIAATGVRFHAKQIGPALNKGDPAVPKILNNACTIVGPVTGIVTASISALNSDTEGIYKCWMEVTTATKTFFSKHTFSMEIWDE